jgi:chemotaxis protein CheD
MAASRVLATRDERGEIIQVRSIHIGGVEVSDEGAIIRTILGSCISVCLRDPRMGVGGMNHFMLPEGESSSFNPASYGVHAMELLINQCMRLGADRRHFEAKVFGGGKMFSTETGATRVAERNIDFALGFLKDERIPIVSQDLGGTTGREVFFYTATGRMRLKRHADRAKEIIEQEQRFRRAKPIVAAPETDITLF